MLEFIGGVALLAWRVIRLTVTFKTNGPLLLHQMVLLGVNSIPISMMVLALISSVFTYVLADELEKRGAGSLIGGLLLLILLRELIPLMTGLALTGKIGAAITSELATMRISEQVDALRALSVDPDWFLTQPRVLAGFLMMPVIATFAGWVGWWSGFYTARINAHVVYEGFVSSVRMLVEPSDFGQCLIKSLCFGATVVLTACYFGLRARGGAAGVGRAVTRSVVCNIVLLFALDLVLTVLMAN